MPSLLRSLFVAAVCAALYLAFDMSTGAERLEAKIGTGATMLSLTQSDPTYVKPQDELDDDALFFYQLFNDNFVTKITDLQKWNSKMLPQPYLDSWYPEASGGTNMTGALGQYDRFFNSQRPLSATWEASYHNSTLEWYGHCNGYSASVTRHQAAANPVNRPKGCQPNQDPSCVTYAPEDIKGLLAEVYMNATARFLGGRRCDVDASNGGLDNVNPHTRTDPTVKDACEDVDPGVLHAALVNWMGIKGQYVIMDLQRDVQVWNYPIYGYSINYGNSGQRLTAAQAATLVWGGALSTYIFNPSAVSFFQVDLTINYAHETSIPANGSYLTKTYQYVLELDAADNIIGGEWINGSITDHPDFIWVAFAPVDQTGAAPGLRTLGNYYVKSQDVLDLWAESMGFNAQDPFNDPNNTIKALPLPTVQLNWGKYPPFFDMTLNGRNTGAAFVGEPVNLAITRESELSGNAQLVLMLNNKAVGTYPVTGDQTISVPLNNVQVGMNYLQFDWSQDGREIATAAQTVAFYVM